MQSDRNLKKHLLNTFKLIKTLCLMFEVKKFFVAYPLLIFLIPNFLVYICNQVVSKLSQKCVLLKTWEKF